MKRRDFITLVGGATAVWPLAASAQHPAMPIIGFLSSRSPADTVNELAAFRRGLADSGYIESQTATIEYKWALGQYDRLPAMATELVRRPVAVLVATGRTRSIGGQDRDLKHPNCLRHGRSAQTRARGEPQPPGR